MVPDDAIAESGSKKGKYAIGVKEDATNFLGVHG